jgi:hypothetical protein
VNDRFGWFSNTRVTPLGCDLAPEVEFLGREGQRAECRVTPLGGDLEDREVQVVFLLGTVDRLGPEVLKHLRVLGRGNPDKKDRALDALVRRQNHMPVGVNQAIGAGDET